MYTHQFHFQLHVDRTERTGKSFWIPCYVEPAELQVQRISEIYLGVLKSIIVEHKGHNHDASSCTGRIE